MRPVIGITQCLDDRGRWRSGRDYLYLDRAYARAVERAGGRAVHLPIQDDVEGLIHGIDGLLLPGGDDLLPDRPYPEGVAFDPAPAEQIAFDTALLHAARALERPLLGICYGAQLMALAHGGHLHYDLPTDLPDALPHRLPEPDGRHRIAWEPGTRLAGLLGDLCREVNSLHHQAVARPGDGLRVAARSEDGVVEAFEIADPLAPFAAGVQWHPEKMEGDAGQRALFAAFVAACRAG